MDNLHKIGHEYGIEFYHKIWMPEEDDMVIVFRNRNLFRNQLLLYTDREQVIYFGQEAGLCGKRRR